VARRKHGKSSGAEALALLLLMGVPLVVIVAVISAIARNPVLLVLLLGGGGGLVAWRSTPGKSKPTSWPTRDAARRRSTRPGCRRSIHICQ
jgi:hypothetical protein